MIRVLHWVCCLPQPCPRPCPPQTFVLLITYTCLELLISYMACHLHIDGHHLVKVTTYLKWWWKLWFMVGIAKVHLQLGIPWNNTQSLNSWHLLRPYVHNICTSFGTSWGGVSVNKKYIYNLIFHFACTSCICCRVYQVYINLFANSKTTTKIFLNFIVWQNFILGFLAMVVATGLCTCRGNLLNCLVFQNFNNVLFICGLHVHLWIILEAWG